MSGECNDCGNHTLECMCLNQKEGFVKKMEWIKKHTDTVVVLGAIFSCFLWMNGRFSGIEKDLSHLDKDLAVIKAVLVMKNIMPCELAHAEESKK